MLRTLFAALLAAGCGGGGELLGSISHEPADAGVGDADPGLGPFAGVAKVDVLSGPNADGEDPTLPSGELEIFFQSDREGTEDIWTSTRQSTDSSWLTPTRVAELSTDAIDLDPTISADGRTVWFVSDRAGSTWSLWVSTRLDRNGSWAEPQPVAELTADVNLRAPCVTADGLTMVFVLEQGPQGGADLFMVRRASIAAPWESPRALAEVNTIANDWDPFIGSDGLVLFWATDDRQIAWADRTAFEQPFVAHGLLAELGTPAFDPTLSLDLHRIYFASDRAGQKDIYEATR